MFLDAFFGLGSSMLPLNLLFIVGLLVWGFFCPYSIVHFFNMCVYIYTYKPSSLSCLAQLTLWLYVCHGIILVGSSAPHSGSLTPHPVGQKRTGRVEVQKFMSWDTDSLIIKKEGGGGSSTQQRGKKPKPRKTRDAKENNFSPLTHQSPARPWAMAALAHLNPPQFYHWAHHHMVGGIAVFPSQFLVHPPAYLLKHPWVIKSGLVGCLGIFLGPSAMTLAEHEEGSVLVPTRIISDLPSPWPYFIGALFSPDQLFIKCSWACVESYKATRKSPFFFFFSSLSSFSLFFLFFLWK